MKTLRLSLVASALALGLGLTGQSMANTTTSTITGKVYGPQENPAVGTVVTITHVPSGTIKRTVVNTAGLFSAQGLRVGGPYQVKVDSDTFADQTINNVYLSLGDAYQLDVQLKQQQIEQISVVATAMTNNYGGDSPATTFMLEDLQQAPSINRDVKDLVRVDPRVYINEASGADGIQCAGGNPRYNSLTVDGVRMNDNFGLNSNGYPTERAPFSFDSIDQVTVELAPFDAKYGGFTACNINAVTKSGTNQLSGGLFYDYTSDSLKGDSIEGQDIDLGSYSEKRYGFNLGMPIIADELFLYVSYEELEGTEIFQYDAFGGDSGVTSEQLDEIIQISKDIYNYDPGSMVPSMPVSDEKLLIKLDWNINEAHRANFVYNYNDGFSLAQSDGGSTRLSLSNHFYERGAEFKSYVGTLFSDWTDNFVTEVRFGQSELDNRQLSLDGDSGFGEFQVRAGNATVYLGPDDSRQANKLNYENMIFKIGGTYYFDEHTVQFGYEFEEFDVFNMFVQHNEGEYRFNSIDDFRNGVARVYYGNASSHDPRDAASTFKYNINTAYVQDEYFVTDYDLTLTFGLRYDWYESDDLPTHNDNFQQRYGFSNAQNLDGVDLIQPRFGFNWQMSDEIEVRGGIGLYSGGNPNVWISNSYSNDGITNIQVNTKNMILLGDDAVEFVDNGTPGYAIPQSLYDAVGSGTADSSTNATDPNFKMPSEWKYALGVTYTTDDDYVLMADILLSRKKDSPIISNLADVMVGTAPDGRPVYDSENHPFNSDLLLTNSDVDGKSDVISLSLSKTFENGFIFTAAYAYTKATDVHPMTSSVAFSNYHNVATSDPQNLSVATSNYEIPHRFTLNLRYSNEFIDGYATTLSLFGQANEGQPYGYNFHRNTSGLGFNDTNRQLFYVPLVDDPIVTYADGVQEELDAFIAQEGLEGYRGSIMPRNVLHSDWWVKFDFRVEQEIIGFNSDHRASAFLVIENLGNLLNDDWGVLKSSSSLSSIVEASVTENGQYLYESFTGADQSSAQAASLWEVRFGIKYDF